MLFTFIDIHSSLHVDTTDGRRFIFSLRAHCLNCIIVLYSVELGSVLFLYFLTSGSSFIRTTVL
jgi:hypothetical protein